MQEAIIKLSEELEILISSLLASGILKEARLSLS